MPSITITGSDASTGNLTLSDNGSTDANRGTVVTWIVGPNSGVSAITSITTDAGSTDVFSPDPSAVGGASKNWQGTVNSAISVPVTEDYTIGWTDSSGGSHSFDPRINVNN